MKAFLCIKYYPDMRNRQQIEEISSALERIGFETVCVVRDLEHWGNIQFSPADLMRHAFAEIEKCDVFICEFSEKGVGLGIEAGYALAKGKPVMAVGKQGSDLSTTLQGIAVQVIFYENTAGLVDALRGSPWIP